MLYCKGKEVAEIIPSSALSKKPIETHNITIASDSDDIQPAAIYSRKFSTLWKTDEKVYFASKRAILYKTEMCRSYTELGWCRYGDNCQFCHFKSELRVVTRHPKYKTEICRTFWIEGSCPYGKRCCFAHQENPRSTGQVRNREKTIPNAANAINTDLSPFLLEFNDNMFSEPELPQYKQDVKAIGGVSSNSVAGSNKACASHINVRSNALKSAAQYTKNAINQIIGPRQGLPWGPSKYIRRPQASSNRSTGTMGTSGHFFAMDFIQAHAASELSRKDTTFTGNCRGNFEPIYTDPVEKQYIPYDSIWNYNTVSIWKKDAINFIRAHHRF